MENPKINKTKKAKQKLMLIAALITMIFFIIVIISFLIWGGNSSSNNYIIPDSYSFKGNVLNTADIYSDISIDVNNDELKLVYIEIVQEFIKNKTEDNTQNVA